MSFLHVHNIGKAYRRYQRKSGRLAEWLGMGCQHELVWILRNISFSVAPGESVGIIGINGVGKSTLLKIIAGTTQPTEGSISAGGKISALLELGLGFHPDFTGRQNAYMSGQLLGLSATEVNTLMPSVEDFAEIGSYIDQPVRVYSSGMQMRLAFSIATAVRPDILIIDEALSVGDTYFQHKSFNRIREFKQAGTTLLFVSHSTEAIKNLCDRAILLENGGIIQDGEPDVVMDYYNAAIAARQADYQIKQLETVSARTSIRSGTGDAVIEKAELEVNGIPTRALISGSAAVFSLTIAIHRPIPELTVGLLIRDRLGNDVFGTNSHYHQKNIFDLSAGANITAQFNFEELPLGAGSYSVSVALHSCENHIANNYDWWDRSIIFEIIPNDGPPAVGVCRLPVSVSLHHTQY